MTSRPRVGLSLCAAVALGLAMSTGYPAGMVAGIGMPIACMMPASRRFAFVAAFGYYVAGLWPMVPGAKHFTGQSAPILIATLMWVGAAMLLSIPWTLAWTPNSRLQYLWRVPLAEIAGILPPLGLVGFISPLTGAGYLFPGTGWAGLIATSVVPGILLAFDHSAVARSRVWPGLAFSAVITLGVCSQYFARQEAKPLANWEAVNTNFGDLSRPFQDFVAAQSIQERVAASPARVVIFPEFVVPRWSEATVAFWRQTLDRCRTRGQILALGVGLPRKFATPQDRAAEVDLVKSYDFARAIQALQVNDGRLPPSLPGSESPAATTAIPFDNTLLILGSESATVYQRVPVPIGMWQPFTGTGVPLRLNEPGIVEIDGQRVAVLICYEQILTYPILMSMLQHPSILVGISNAFWFTSTPIPRYQANAVRAWARLLGVPFLLAANS
jgi:apolipoprotein N-acyltransferase